jgi:hypothetical protein
VNLFKNFTTAVQRVGTLRSAQSKLSNDSLSVGCRRYHVDQSRALRYPNTREYSETPVTIRPLQHPRCLVKIALPYMCTRQYHACGSPRNESTQRLRCQCELYSYINKRTALFVLSVCPLHSLFTTSCTGPNDRQVRKFEGESSIPRLLSDSTSVSVLLSRRSREDRSDREFHIRRCARSS